MHIAGFPLMTLRKILVVDDDKLLCWSIARILTPRNGAVKCVSGVREAIAEVTGERFDLILLDINLPDGNGLDLLETIRCVAPDTKIIILSGDASPMNRERAHAIGASRFIEKPFENDHLVNAAENVLAGPE